MGTSSTTVTQLPTITTTSLTAIKTTLLPTTTSSAITLSSTITTISSTKKTTSITTTSRPKTSTTAELDCNALCANASNDNMVATGCCSDQYCWCTGDGEGWTTDCKPPGDLFCQKTGSCTPHCLSDVECCGVNIYQVFQETNLKKTRAKS